MSDQSVINNIDQPFHAVRISEHVYWVGAIDWGLRDFHGYSTHRGTTYNAYLVLGKKNILMDTVKAPFREEMMARIATVIDPKSIDIIFSNHSEMDHSGSLPEVIEQVQPEKVFASAFGVKALEAHFHPNFPVQAVADGETLTLGDHSFTCIETRMLHWPDSMFTFFHKDGVLFTNDGFGMHLATIERFDDEVDPGVLEYEARKYYANILLPYSNLVLKLFDRLPTLGFDISMIAPDHGPVWRSHIDKILNYWRVWAEQRPTDKAVVVYDTMWQSTAKLARAISEGLGDNGARALVLPLRDTTRSDVITEILEAGAIVAGSPTLNNNMFPTVADFLTYMKGLRPRNLVGAAFGSFGWGGEGVAQVREMLEAAHVEIISENLKVKYVPDSAALAEAYALGKLTAERITPKE